jgi:signal transduction histidine kinase
MSALPSDPPSAPGVAPVQDEECSRGPGDPAGQMSILFRLTTVLHGLTDLGAISSALLSTLISEQGLAFDRAVLFLLDDEKKRLRGYDAAGERERALTLDFWRLLDHFPESLSDAVRLTLDPRRRLRSPLSKKARRVSVALDDPNSPVAEAARSGRVVCPVVQGRLDPEDIVQALGHGPWSFWPVTGTRGVAGVLGVAGGYAHPLPEAVRAPLVMLTHHAGLSLERGRTYQDLERQIAEMATVQEVSRGILSATNLVDLLLLISRVSSRVMEAGWAVTWVAEGPEETLRVASSCGLEDDGGTLLERLRPFAQKCVETRRSSRRTDAATDGTLPAREDGNPRSMLLVPLVAFDRTVGVLGVGDRESTADRDTGVFHEADEQFLSILASQAAIAVKNAQLFEQVREAEKRLRETQALLMQTEKLAALGEMSAKVAHEIRTPLSAVGGFARRIRRSLADDDPNAEHATLIVKEIQRLEEILTEQLEFARLSRPRLAMTSLVDVVRETLLLVREEAERQGVIILEEEEAGLPTVLLDPDRVKQVLLNILKNALGAVVRGNRIFIRTDRAGGDLRVEISNDGAPLPGEILDSLFVPFATTRAGGSGLGLAVAHQIVKEHGGEIQVRTGGAWSVTFVVSFPIRENQDRRRVPPDRRNGRDRRRAT